WERGCGTPPIGERTSRRRSVPVGAAASWGGGYHSGVAWTSGRSRAARAEGRLTPLAVAPRLEFAQAPLERFRFGLGARQFFAKLHHLPLPLGLFVVARGVGARSEEHADGQDLALAEHGQLDLISGTPGLDEERDLGCAS